MNLYYTGICQLLNGDKELEGNGYLVKTEDGRVVYSDIAPFNVQIITFEKLEDALFEGTKHIINGFVNSDDNKGVYAFNLYADEYDSFYVYLNTDSSFEKTIEQNYSHYTEDRKNDVKYNQGDFSFQFFPSDMGVSRGIVEGCENVASSIKYEDNIDNISPNDTAIIAYERKIFNDGFYLAAFNALKRIGNSSELDKLNKSKNFIYYASTGNDYVDYSLVMRKTIDNLLFYNCFPELKNKDEEFQAHIEYINSKSIVEIIDYWEEALQGEFNEGAPYSYIKMEYQIFEGLKVFSNSIAEENIHRLELKIDDDLKNNVIRNKVDIYLKTLEFIELNEDLINKLRLVLIKVEKIIGDEFLSNYLTHIQKEIVKLISKSTMKADLI
ncbi:MAG: hypothetical protein NAG76_20860 [Candidatus Pristimantibacillus lignocellulolyticus]|uniref:Uncharacterized protein n=1 Tax=Candidatus Pristimantibacillus lignocellulolyticus TaxID=2994561 RepID=A0A9J6ZDK7_9BACL|nr:MAG: hypothetical protein NAG76_20860 [Candidatus Pristimantibacillus lignocellulolyticus]